MESVKRERGLCSSVGTASRTTLFPPHLRPAFPLWRPAVAYSAAPAAFRQKDILGSTLALTDLSQGSAAFSAHSGDIHIELSAFFPVSHRRPLLTNSIATGIIP